MDYMFKRISKHYIIKVFIKCKFFDSWKTFVGLSGCLNVDRYMSEHNPADWIDICIVYSKDDFWREVKVAWCKFLMEMDIFLLNDYLNFYQRSYLNSIKEWYVEGYEDNGLEQIKLEFE